MQNQIKKILLSLIKNQKFITLSILCIVFTLFFHCKNSNPIKIGFIACLTGVLSDMGISSRDGVMLATEEVNNAGGINGRRIELIIKNDKNDAKVAIQVAKQLIDEKIIAIIGHITSSMSIASLPIINENKILMISPTATTNKLSGLDDYFFRMVQPDKIEAEFLAQYLYKNKKIRKISVIYDLSNRAFTEESLLIFKSKFENLGGSIVFTSSFTSKENVTYNDFVSNILNRQNDGIVILAGAIDTAMICQHIRKKNKNIQIITSGWAWSSDLIAYGGSAVEEVIFINQFNSESSDENFLLFRKRFIQRFGREPDFAATFSYETAQILFTLLKNSDESVNIKNDIIKQSKFSGLQGEIVFDKNGDPIRNFNIFMIKNGRCKLVGN